MTLSVRTRTYHLSGTIILIDSINDIPSDRENVFLLDGDSRDCSELDVEIFLPNSGLVTET